MSLSLDHRILCETALGSITQIGMGLPLGDWLWERPGGSLLEFNPRTLRIEIGQ